MNDLEVFEFSTNPEDELYLVNFTSVGVEQGNYMIASSNAISNIYEYIAPVDGVKQGDYEPIVRLVAPVKLQLAVVNGSFVLNKNTFVNFEFAASKNDLNLYSSLEDQDNGNSYGDNWFSCNRRLFWDEVQEYEPWAWGAEHPVGKKQVFIGRLKIKYES